MPDWESGPVLVFDNMLPDVPPAAHRPHAPQNNSNRRVASTLSANENAPDRYRTHPQTVKTFPHVRIPLSDGVELSARVWLPETAVDAPVPAVLEYIPYRKNDMTAARDLTIHPEFARAGYASIRVDLRGCGDSSGLMTDEYSETELSDGLEVLRWIAEQSWCDGKVGIIGKSWGGFNGLQLAALQPPELAAVISVCSTDDRYADDVHYNGGAIVADQMLSWASTMWAYNARPQDPDVVGAQWRDNWASRIDDAPVNIEDWLSHQRRDAYWKHGSVCEDPSAIQVPVLAVGGLLDEYRTTLFRLMETADATIHALLGPWSHNYPHQGVPGPAIDFIAESIRWWDHWMKGVDNGVAAQPQLRAYMPESTHVGTDLEYRPGRWVSEPVWPSPNVENTLYSECNGTIRGQRAQVSTAPVGLAAGSWLQFGPAAGQPGDQRTDDEYSFVIDWTVNDQPVEILGTPRAELNVKSDQETGVVAVRLCDVAPDGSSQLVTMGLFNLTHKDSHEFPVPLVPNEPVHVTVPLLATAHRFQPGHKIRMSVSAACWPLLWPSVKETTVSIMEAAIRLPVRNSAEGSHDEWEQREFRLPPTVLASPITVHGTPTKKLLQHDLVSGESTVKIVTEDWQFDDSNGLYYYTYECDEYVRNPHDPLSAQAVCTRVIKYKRMSIATATAGICGDNEHFSWDVEVRTESRMTGDETRFFVTNRLEAFDRGEPFRTRQTQAEIARDFN